VSIIILKSVLCGGFLLIFLSTFLPYRSNDKRIELLQVRKIPFLFSSSHLVKMVDITTSLKTKMAFIHAIGPRLVDPGAKSEVLKDLFRFSEQKNEVEEILKARLHVITSEKFTRPVSGDYAANGRGGGRGGIAGRAGGRLLGSAGRGGGRGVVPVTSSSSSAASISTSQHTAAAGNTEKADSAVGSLASSSDNNATTSTNVQHSASKIRFNAMSSPYTPMGTISEEESNTAGGAPDGEETVAHKAHAFSSGNYLSYSKYPHESSQLSVASNSNEAHDEEYGTLECASSESATYGDRSKIAVLMNGDSDKFFRGQSLQSYDDEDADAVSKSSLALGIEVGIAGLGVKQSSELPSLNQQPQQQRMDDTTPPLPVAPGSRTSSIGTMHSGTPHSSGYLSRSGTPHISPPPLLRTEEEEAEDYGFILPAPSTDLW
jgi:hypothetical protein